jgi:predicted nucleic acid-binding protein
MTTSHRIDTSVAIKLITPNPDQERTVALMTQWQQDGVQLVAPTLWAYGVTSVFAKLVHFGQLSAAQSREALRLAFQLAVQLVPPDAEQVARAFAWTEQLQRMTVSTWR